MGVVVRGFIIVSCKIMSSGKPIIEKRKRRQKKGGGKKKKRRQSVCKLSRSDFSPNMALYFNFAN
jgi:hypothetical protein